MPYSSSEGKAWLISRIVEANPSVIVDIGAGSGTYSKHLRHLLKNSMFIAMEVWEPYVSGYFLDQEYHRVIIGDVRETPIPPCNAVILGDVLEHMGVEEACAVWDRCRQLSEHVFLSLPIVEYPQGEEFGNPHEKHVATWDHDMVLEKLPGIVAWEVGQTIGVYHALGATLHPQYRGPGD
jgi:hypothetical protein